MPGGTPSSPSLASTLPGVPGEPDQAAQGRALPGAVRDPVGRGGEPAGRRRHRVHRRGPVLRRPRRRPDLDQHDPGAVVRPERASTAAPPGPTARRSSPRRKVGVLGAGMMGAGIAHAFAKVGVDVVLKDVSTEAAEKGKAHVAGLVGKQVVPRPDDAGEGRRLPRPHHARPGTPPTSPAATSSSRPSSRTRRSSTGCSARPSGTPSRTRCWRRTPRRCRSPGWPRACSGRRTSWACTSSRRWTRCRWSS